MQGQLTFPVVQSDRIIWDLSAAANGAMPRQTILRKYIVHSIPVDDLLRILSRTRRPVSVKWRRTSWNKTRSLAWQLAGTVLVSE